MKKRKKKFRRLATTTRSWPTLSGLFVRWSRFGELFRYDEAVQRITLVEQPYFALSSSTGTLSRCCTSLAVVP